MPTPIIGGTEVCGRNHWCGEHEPQSDVCPIHQLRFRELHIGDDDVVLKSIFNLRAVFFCPVLGCDKYSFPGPGPYFPKEPGWAGSSVLGAVVLRLAALNKILFHKLSLSEGDGK